MNTPTREEFSAAVHCLAGHATTHERALLSDYDGTLGIRDASTEILKAVLQRAETAELGYALWYRRCASLVWALSGSTTAGEIVKWEADYVTELAKAEARITGLERENARLRAELAGIVDSENACGCTPVCRCNDNVLALLAWKEATIEGIKAALAGTKEAK